MVCYFTIRGEYALPEFRPVDGGVVSVPEKHFKVILLIILHEHIQTTRISL